MEDLLNNDSTFELFTNSSDSKMLNKTLMSYPSEKSSFHVFLGANGNKMDDYSYFESKFDSEKLSESIAAGTAAIGAVAETVQAFRGDGTRTTSRRKQLKQVCGRKPLLKKNRGEYDKCVANYNAANLASVGDSETRTGGDMPTQTPTPTKDNTKTIIIGVAVVAVLVTAFIGYKKGWFAKKAA